MRRLAFLAAASLAFIAISEPISANTSMQEACRQRRENKKLEPKYERCRKACNSGGRYNELSSADKKKWVKCQKDCEQKYPAPSTQKNYDPRLDMEAEKRCRKYR